MRNNNIIILASIIALSFVGGTAKAVQPSHLDILDVYKRYTSSAPQKWPTCTAPQAAAVFSASNVTFYYANYKTYSRFEANTSKTTEQTILANAKSKCISASGQVVYQQPTKDTNDKTKVSEGSDDSDALASGLSGFANPYLTEKFGKKGNDSNAIVCVKGKPCPIAEAAKKAQEKTNKADDTVGSKVSGGEKDDKGYVRSTVDTDQSKKVIVSDAKSGASIVSTTTTNKDGKTKTDTIAYDKDGKQIDMSTLPQEMQDKVKEPIAQATGENKDTFPDTPEGKKAAAAAAAKDAQTKSELTQLKSVNTEILNEVKKCQSGLCSQVAGLLNTAETQGAEAEAEQTKCDGSSSKADFLCPIATNPQVQAAGVLMNGLSAAIPSISSAKDTCAVTSKVNLIGQSVIGVGTVVCGTYKSRCENKCGDTNAKYDAVKDTYNGVDGNLKTALAEAQSKKAIADTSNPPDTAESQAQQKNIDAITAAQNKLPNVAKIINPKYEANVATTKKCDGYKIDLGQMVVTVGNMVAAAAQAKACEQQLASLDSTNNTAQVYTMDEMCAQAQNVNSTICKCRSDNTAVGCPGYIAGSGNEGNINKGLNTKGPSNMAGLSYGSKITPTGGASSLDTNLDGLSDEAKKALAAGGDQKQDGSMFGGAGAANAGGGAGTASAAGAGGAADKGKFAEEPKSIGSSFMNAVGSLFGKGGSGGKTTAAKDDKFASDKYKEQIKRQIAAEQMRSEISSASGMDNWTKIRTRYKSNAASLIDSN